MGLLLIWWIIVSIFVLWVLGALWEFGIKERLSIILVGVILAFGVPYVVVKVVPFAQWFLHIIGA